MFPNWEFFAGRESNGETICIENNEIEASSARRLVRRVQNRLGINGQSSDPLAPRRKHSLGNAKHSQQHMGLLGILPKRRLNLPQSRDNQRTQAIAPQVKPGGRLGPTCSKPLMGCASKSG